MKIKNPVLFSFFLCCLLGAGIVVPNMIAGGGIYHLTADFDYQEIPFHMMMNESIKNGRFLFTWFNDLGSNFIASFTFYNLFSPFTLLGFLFPSHFIPYLLGPMYILKYGVCGLFSALYMKRYVKDYKYVVLGALLYTFSGYQFTNILFYHFHDAVAFFPLLLYSLDELFYNHKKGFFGISVFLMAITNWFFCIESGIFVFLYFFVKIWNKDYQVTKSNMISFFLEGVLGILLSSFVLIPSFLFTLSNPRIESHWTLLELFKYPFSNYIELVRAFILPADAMTSHSFFDIGNYSSVELYLPIVGCVFVFSYLWKHPKSTFSLLLMICFVLMLVPILNSIFVFFNVQYYARWFMMPLLIMSLVSAMGMEEKLDLKKGFYFSIFFIFLLVGLLLVYHHFKGVKIFSLFHVCLVFVLGILGIVLTKFFSSKYRVLFVSIVAFISLYGNYMVGLYKSYQTPEMAYSTYIQKNSELQKLKNVRSYSSNCPPNLSLVQEIPNLHSFHSNISGGAFSFYRSLGIERETSTIINDPELLSFLGVQKMITCQGDNYFISDVDSLPIGFSPNHIILQEDFEKLDYSGKINHLMDGVVLTKEQKKKYGNLISTDSVLTDFHFLSNGFSIDYISEKDSFIVIQVPYDSGWSVSNGTIEEVDYGLMGVVVPKGSGTLQFYYHVPGLLLGVILSFFSFVLFFVYFIINKKA